MHGGGLGADRQLPPSPIYRGAASSHRLARQNKGHRPCGGYRRPPDRGAPPPIPFDAIVRSTACTLAAHGASVRAHQSMLQSTAREIIHVVGARPNFMKVA